jgi:hypothetical protein
MLRAYALAPETIRRLLSRTFWRFQFIALLSFLGFAGYLAMMAGPIQWGVAGPILGLIAAAYFFIIFFNLRQQLRMLYSARYEIDDSSVVYRQIKQLPLHISRANIVKVSERPDGIWIETTSPKSNLFVPYGLARDGDLDIYNTLQLWVKVMPLERRRRIASWLLVFILASSLLVLLFANNLWLVLGLGLFILTFGTYAETRLRKNNSVPFTTIRMYNMAFSFLVIIIFMKACLIAFMVLNLR